MRDGWYSSGKIHHLAGIPLFMSNRGGIITDIPLERMKHGCSAYVAVSLYGEFEQAPYTQEDFPTVCFLVLEEMHREGILPCIQKQRIDCNQNLLCPRMIF